MKKVIATLFAISMMVVASSTVAFAECELGCDDTVTITKATPKKDGTITRTCNVCSRVEKYTIPKPTKMVLNKDRFVYNGKVQKPEIHIEIDKYLWLDSESYDYSYSKGCKNVGTYTVTAKLIDEYEGVMKKKFKIVPKTTSVKSVAGGKKKITVKWKKQTTQTTGYQVQYATNSKFTGAKKVTINKNSSTSKTISKLKANKKCYVRIRTYKTVKGVKYYGNWSGRKSAKTK